MGYVAFDFSDFPPDAATLATTATVRAHAPPSVASVATVAGAPRVSSEESEGSVATVATVARVDRKTEFETVASVATVAIGISERGFPLIEPDEVAMMYGRAVSACMSRGLVRAEAEVAALPVLRSKLGNDARLAPPYAATNACLMCGEHDGAAGPLVSVLSPAPGSHVIVHSGDCHQRYRASIADKVRECMDAAGLGLDWGTAPTRAMGR